jgi:hypothetical protein
LIRQVAFVSLGHDSQTPTPFYLISSEFSKTADEFSDGLLSRWESVEVEEPAMK